MAYHRPGGRKFAGDCERAFTLEPDPAISHPFRFWAGQHRLFPAEGVAGGPRNVGGLLALRGRFE